MSLRSVLVAVVAAAGALAAGCAAGAGAGTGAGRTTGGSSAPRPPPGTGAALHTTLLGRSTLGRPIFAHEIGDPASARKVLVVGAVHGDEPAGIAVAHRLERSPAIAAVDLWVIDDLNPDGVVARTRQNGRGVDLNRNFPYRWQPAGRPGEQQYPGARPLSEPEARAAHALIMRIHPAVTIWFHQPLGLVDQSGGARSVEARFARLSGLPLVRLTRYPGSAVGWQDHAFPASTAFVVELGPGRQASASVSRLSTAVATVAAGR